MSPLISKAVAFIPKRVSIQQCRHYVLNYDDADIVGEVVATMPWLCSCPKCGSEMVRRVAKRGANAGNAFWGCVKYPRCNGTRNPL